MCFSAIVMQRAKKLGIMFQARIQTEIYADLFERRLNGEKILIGRGLEADFLDHPQSSVEEKIRENILHWHTAEAERIQTEILKQSERQQTAQLKLQSKATQKAKDDLRISTQKIAKLSQDLVRHQNLSDLTESDDRIFPRSMASMVCTDSDGQKVIRPARYLLRPHNKDESFDFKFTGCYNARRDGLQSVPWWKDALGRRHGLMLVRRFYEYVGRENYLRGTGQSPETVSSEANLEVRFTPLADEWLLVPTLWDEWKSKSGQVMFSAAIITDNPLPEVQVTGHDRTPIFLTASAAEQWLQLKDSSTTAVDNVLNQKHTPHLQHKLRSVAGLPSQ